MDRRGLSDHPKVQRSPFAVCGLIAAMALVVGPAGTASGATSGSASGPAPSARSRGVVTQGPSVVTKVFRATGKLQIFDVPDGVTTVHVTAIGARGGHGFNSADHPGGSSGIGAKVSADIPTMSADRLVVAVGGDGEDGKFAYSGDGGFNGGGDGGGHATGGGGGGGASDIRDAPGAYAPLLLAGGGGGGGSAATFAGGRGGSYGGSGGNGGGAATRETRCYGLGGGGGTDNGPGKGGKARISTALVKGDCPSIFAATLPGTDGQYFAAQPTGGRGGNTPTINGGGGGAGGGYFGGGGGGSGSSGGSGGGGGAGSSYVEPSASNPSFQQAPAGEAPSVAISYQQPPEPASVDLTVSPIPGYAGEHIDLNATVHGGPTPRPHVEFLFARCSTSGQCEPAHRLGEDEVDPNGTAHLQVSSLAAFDCYVFYAGYADAGDRTLDTIGCYQILNRHAPPPSNAPPTSNETTPPSPS